MLSRDDLDALGDRAGDTGDPAVAVARLVAAAEQGLLADPADAAYAYLLAAELHEEADDLVAALALVDRALGTGSVPAADLARLRSCRARLRGELGYDDEPPDLGEEPANLDGEPADFDGEPGDLGDADPDPVADVDELVAAGQRPEGGGVLLVWSREAYEQVDQQWPEVLEPTGAETWEAYRTHCRSLLRPGTLLVVGDAEGFAEWLADNDADPYADLVALAREYGAYLAEYGDPVELPANPADPCWCGSGKGYGQCCQL